MEYEIIADRCGGAVVQNGDAEAADKVLRR